MIPSASECPWTNASDERSIVRTFLDTLIRTRARFVVSHVSSSQRSIGSSAAPKCTVRDRSGARARAKARMSSTPSAASTAHVLRCSRQQRFTRPRTALSVARMRKNADRVGGRRDECERPFCDVIGQRAEMVTMARLRPRAPAPSPRQLRGRHVGPQPAAHQAAALAVPGHGRLFCRLDYPSFRVRLRNECPKGSGGVIGGDSTAVLLFLQLYPEYFLVVLYAS